MAKQENKKTDSNKSEEIVEKVVKMDFLKFSSLISVSPRDRGAISIIYRMCEDKLTLKGWLMKIENDGFNVKNREQLLEQI